MNKEIARKVAKTAAMVKAPRLTYLLRHPIKGPKNLLALRGAKSLLKTKAGAVATAAVAAAAVAGPLAVMALRKANES